MMLFKVLEQKNISLVLLMITTDAYKNILTNSVNN